MRFGENALKVIDRVKEKIGELEEQGAFPEGVELVTTYDRADLIHRSIDTLKRTLFEEMLIVSIVILLFLLHVRSALVAIITLPIAVAVSFVPMYFLGISSNVMSLGGIAIAIGAMVDAAVVLIENAHKRLESAPPDAPRLEVILEAAKEVGRPIFFSLLVITISFLPVFTLQGQSGRLFKPLAYTKTFSMFFAAVLSITLAPALMALLIRGRIRSEKKHPVSRFLIWLYRPFVRLALRYRWLTVAAAVVILGVSVFPFLGLGSEFMPPLDEGSLLYMPTTLPGISIEEARKVLQEQDRILRSFPEVETVFGKVGRARTSTDPAPLSMVETTIMLKPKSEWRPHLRNTHDLAAEMDKALRFPGFVNSLYGPIKTRIDMLTTGIRTPIGIKVYGKDLPTIQRLGEQLESILNRVPDTRSVIADRVTGGYFIDFTPRREEIARYGLTVEDVLTVVETAIGGMTIDSTVEGRERYSINVRYPRGLRDDPEKLRRVLVHTPVGAQVPITQLADIRLSTGPPVIKDEKGSLVGYVYVDVTTRDIGGYVKRAKELVKAELELPSGYYLEWTGQFELLEKMKDRMRTVLPITLLLIVLLLYLNFKSVAETLIVLASVPFALVGSVCLLWVLGYNLSVAVWVGVIALAGVATETGIVMIVYLDEAFERFRREGRMRTLGDLLQAVTEGAVLRVRPKMMTVMTTILGLLPLMWSHGTGADTMKRIAAPMVGGLLTSTVLTLVIIPAAYAIWRRIQFDLPPGRPTPPPGTDRERG
jgi:Cu(I)/Ag(I) efflux system membrane protein CusA/SilA